MKPQPVAPPPVAMKPEPIAPQPVATKMSPVLYGMLDTEVTPPVVIQQAVPPWTFAPQLKTGVFTGTLELVVDERGAVESVKLVEPVWAPYDAALLEAAKGWRYEPALKEGKPVKFKRFLAIRVDPRGPRSR
jgi:TonB family protein